MKSITQLILCLFINAICIPLHAQSPVKIIFDTDIDSDVDDVGALAMLHTFADHNAVEILGVIVTTEDQYAVQCTDAINHYFKRPDIPIGALKDVPLRDNSKYTRQISQEYPHSLASYDEAEEATALYRRLLSAQPDSSVIIITVGHLSSLMNLLESGPDQYSPLSGPDLIQKKVKFWSCMGGMYPEGDEANFIRPDPASTIVSVEKWPGQVVFSGWELGNKIITGGDYVKKSLSSESPVWRAYQLYNNFQGRPSWDQASVLYAISNSSDYWDLQKEGHLVIAEDGGNQWVAGENENQAYLVEKMKPTEVAKIIDAIMTGIYSSDF